MACCGRPVRAGGRFGTALPHTDGLVLGPVVFASGYVVLALAKLYKPIWEYDGPTSPRT